MGLFRLYGHIRAHFVFRELSCDENGILPLCSIWSIGFIIPLLGAAAFEGCMVKEPFQTRPGGRRGSKLKVRRQISTKLCSTSAAGGVTTAKSHKSGSNVEINANERLPVSIDRSRMRVEQNGQVGESRGGEKSFQLRGSYLEAVGLLGTPNRDWKGFGLVGRGDSGVMEVVGGGEVLEIGEIVKASATCNLPSVRLAETLCTLTKDTKKNEWGGSISTLASSHWGTEDGAATELGSPQPPLKTLQKKQGNFDNKTIGTLLISGNRGANVRTTFKLNSDDGKLLGHLPTGAEVDFFEVRLLAAPKEGEDEDSEDVDSDSEDDDFQVPVMRYRIWYKEDGKPGCMGWISDKGRWNNDPYSICEPKKCS